MLIIGKYRLFIKHYLTLENIFFNIKNHCVSERQVYHMDLQAQYEFLHRAIVNYAELHGLSET